MTGAVPLDDLPPGPREAALWTVREQLRDVTAEVWRRRFGEALLTAIIVERKLDKQLRRYAIDA